MSLRHSSCRLAPVPTGAAMDKVLVPMLPLLLATYFAVVYSAAYAAFRSSAPERMNRWGGVAYLIFLVAALAVLWPRIAAPHLWSLHPTFPLWLTVAVASGYLLFQFELLASIGAARLFPSRWTEKWSIVIEGGTSRYAGPESTSFLFGISAIAVVVPEEILYRGLALQVMRDDFGMSAIAAILAAGLLFGLGHYYFGVRNIVLKTIDGVVWGCLVVVTGGILAAIASHLTFQTLVWYRLSRQPRRPPYSLRHRPGPGTSLAIGQELGGPR
jgi:membrane protease YdiL (CAAX protease family)